MKYIDLSSSDFYNIRDGNEVTISVLKQSIFYSELSKPCELKVGDRIMAGWTKSKSFECEVISVKNDVSWDFDDENKWNVTIKRI